MEELYLGMDKEGVLVSGRWNEDSILPEGQTMHLVTFEDAGIGWTWTGSQYVPPEEVEEELEALDYIQMKKDLWEASSKVVLDYFEQTQAEAAGLEIEDPMSAEEFKTWLVYRQKLKAWDPVPDNPVPNRL